MACQPLPNNAAEGQLVLGTALSGEDSQRSIRSRLSIALAAGAGREPERRALSDLRGVLLGTGRLSLPLATPHQYSAKQIHSQSYLIWGPSILQRLMGGLFPASF